MVLNLSSLPPDVFYEILSHLTTNEIFNISQVSRFFRSLVNGDNLWKFLSSSLVGDHDRSIVLDITRSSWKEVFFQSRSKLNMKKWNFKKSTLETYDKRIYGLVIEDNPHSMEEQVLFSCSVDTNVRYPSFLFRHGANLCRVWNLREKTSYALSYGYTDSIYCISSLHDGRSLISGSEKGRYVVLLIFYPYADLIIVIC